MPKTHHHRPQPPRGQADRQVDHPPFTDRSEFLEALCDAVREHVSTTAPSEEPPADTDEFDYVPPHLRSRRRGSRRGPHRTHQPPWADPHGPPLPSRGPVSVASSLRNRIAATRRHDRAFPWPHEALAKAVGIDRYLAGAVIILRAFEADRLGPGYPTQSPEPEVIGELCGRLLRVRKDVRARITQALQPGGDLVRGGLVRPLADEESRHYCHGPGFLLPRAIRRFIDGRPTPLEPTRLLLPGAESPEAWMSADSARRIQAQAAGQVRARRLLASPDLPIAAVRSGLGPMEICVPKDVPAAGLAGALASALDRPVLDGLPRPQSPEPGRAELVAEARLRGAVLLLEADESPPQGGSPFPFGPDEDSEPWPSELLIVRLSRGAPSEGGLQLEPPGTFVRAELWERALRALDEPIPENDMLDRLASLPLHPEQIVAAAAEHVMTPGDGDGRTTTLLQTAGRGIRRDGPGAEIPQVRLSDVILAPALRAEAEQAFAACMDWKRLAQRLAGTTHDSYGRTPVLLFSGPSGTGKTRLAEALAGEQARPLRRLSGPDLRSCWFGESEKQIRTEFRRRDPAILFLDEIDGFLGKRGGSAATHHDDRLANVLLEEIERTEHVVVMATNRADHLDPAVRRRVLFHLQFEKPGRAEREAIWRLHLPEGVPGATEVDCERLAAHALSGGAIKNASWRAILRATREEADLTTARVEEEARREAAGAPTARGRAGFGRS